MYEFSLRFADLSFRFSSPFPVRITEQAAPFQIPLAQNPDVTVSFEPIPVLPALPAGGIWAEDLYDTVLDGVPTTFVRNLPSQPPYAFFQFQASSIFCRYLPGTQMRLNETSSILNLVGIEKILLAYSAFLLHSSLIRYHNRGILFSATCGVGKSTQANLWNQFRNADILNGDRAGIRIQDGVWQAYGMPFAGTSNIYRNEKVPISAIVTLEQAPENSIQLLSPREAIFRLLSECSCRRWDAVFMDSMMDLLMRLISQVPVYLLSCRPDEGAVNLLEQTLQKEGLL